MMPKWQRLAGLAREVCTLWFQFFGAVFASKGYPFKNILNAILWKGNKPGHVPVYAHASV